MSAVRERAVVLVLLIAAIVAPASAVSPQGRAMRLLEAGDAAAAAALTDSLSRAEPGDRVAAFWAGRSEEEAGRVGAACCRYRSLEAAAPGTREALLAQWRRRALERAAADALAARGPDVPQGGASADQAGAVLLLPPENSTAPDDTPLFGVAWTYLLHESLRGSGVCPVPMPVALAAVDLLRYGKAIRAPLAVSSAPVNTVEGLRARLSVLAASDGTPYLESPAGEWGGDLEAALIRFQRDHGIPPTGEADLSTQAPIDEALLSRLQAIPPPVDPKLVSRVAGLCGASVVVRGAWRRDEGRIIVEMSLLDGAGAPRFGEPVTVSFAAGEEPAAAGDAAARLALRLGGGALVPMSGWSLTPPELEQAAATLLLLDRGLPRPALERWARAPLSWFRWPALASARDVSQMGPEEVSRLETSMRQAWLSAPELDLQAAFDGLMSGLGLPAGPSPAPHGSPAPWRVVGGEGIIVIHGEQE